MTADLVPVVRQLAASQRGTLFLGPGLIEQLHVELRHVGLQRGREGPAPELLLLSAMSEVTTVTLPVVEFDPLRKWLFNDIARGWLAAAQDAHYLPHLSSIIIDLDGTCGHDNTMFYSRYLKWLGWVLVRHPDLSIQLWLPPSDADMDALRARVVAAEEAAPDADQAADEAEVEEEAVHAEWWEMNMEDKDAPLSLTPEQRQALLTLLFTCESTIGGQESKVQSKSGCFVIEHHVAPVGKGSGHLGCGWAWVHVLCCVHGGCMRL